jgi:hypothetical protein
LPGTIIGRAPPGSVRHKAAQITVAVLSGALTCSGTVAVIDSAAALDEHRVYERRQHRFRVTPSTHLCRQSPHLPMTAVYP